MGYMATHAFLRVKTENIDVVIELSAQLALCATSMMLLLFLVITESCVSLRDCNHELKGRYYSQLAPASARL